MTAFDRLLFLDADTLLLGSALNLKPEAPNPKCHALNRKVCTHQPQILSLKP